MGEEDLERYETDVELQIYKEYRDVLPMFRYVIETERRFYLANGVDVNTRRADGSVYFELELTVNKGTAEAYDLGTGYGHIAFAVDDLDAEHARFKAAGLEPRDIVEFNRDGALMARFFFVQDPDGYKIEVLQKHGRYK